MKSEANRAVGGYKLPFSASFAENMAAILRIRKDNFP
jgi:hypothetical protein